MSEVIETLRLRFQSGNEIPVERAMITRQEFEQLEQQLKTAKADGVRECIPTIKAMDEPAYLKGRFQAELFWRGAFAAQKLAEEYANNLEGK